MSIPAPDLEDLVNLVDIARYPVHDPNDVRYDELALRCRRELAEAGVSVLDGFLSRATLARLVGEAEQLAGFGHASDVPGTPYLELPSDHWPSGHPRTTWSHTKLTAISYDKFPSDSALRKLYESDAFLAFLRAALGFDIYRYDDPLGGLNIAAMYDGDELAWHFDQTDFVVSIAIQSSERGGEFECAPRIRSAEDERYDDVAAVLAGDHHAVATVPMTPGTLMLFEGRSSLHRVAPIVGSQPRYVALFGYDRKPGTCSSDLLREIRYGTKNE